MNVEFIIPLNKEDLQSRTNTSQYVVDEVLTQRQLHGELHDCKSAFRSAGAMAILDKFDVFYSILSHFNNLGNDMKEEAWDLLLKMQGKRTEMLASVLQESSLDSGSKHKHRNAIKMTSYILCQFTEAFEAEFTKPSITALTGKGRRKPSKKPVCGLEWEKEREHFTQSTLQIIQLQLLRVWEPPVVEEEYVNLIANCCYKLLENPDVARDKTTKEAIFRILGTLAKRYNHSLSASLKMIQLLQHFEHLCSPLAQAVEMFVNEFGVKTVVSEIMREIGRMDPKDLTRDNSGTKAYATFLVEMAERIPAEMLPNISVLLCHLDEESYTMRNGVLSVMGEIVIRVLSKEDLEKKDKSDRDQFLDILEDHIHDINAFVRSKVLQIWHRICDEKVIPLNRYKDVMSLVIGRLDDKSSIVRKNAIQLISVFLAGNPFAATLPVEDLKTKLEGEKKKLQEMLPDQPIDTIIGVGGKAALAWNKMEKGVIAAIKELSQLGEENKKEGLDDGADIDSVFDSILELLEKTEYLKAVSLLQSAMEEFPGNELFQRPPQMELEDESGDGEEDKNEKTEENGSDKLNSDEQHILNTLKAIYFGSQGDDSPFPAPTELMADPEAIAEKVQGSQQESEEGNAGGAVNEVSKQQVLVMYLQDCVTFATQIRTAVPMLCKLLSSKVASDVMETVEFFVIAFECGLSNALEGVRHMLALVWSKEQGVKDAVVAAYKRLYLNPSGNSQRAKALAIVKNLTALTVGSTVGELKSLGALISELVTNQEVSSQVIQVLWERFTLKIPNTSADESKVALILLGMAAKGDINIVRSNVDVLINTGLGERASDDFLLAKETCVALLKLTQIKKAKGSVGEEPLRFPMDHEMFTKLADLMVQGIEKLDDKFWVAMAEQAVNVIYGLGEHPDVICGDIIKKLISVLMKTIEKGAGDNENEDRDLSCHPALLTRLFAVIGHVAFRQLYHLDVSILAELKRRRAIKENEKEAATAKKKSEKDKTKAEPSMEEEMGLTGAVADDTEAEYMKKILDNDIVTGSNLLALFSPLIMTICSNSTKYSHPELRASATMALAKFMLVSADFCEAHLQLLFTLLEKAQEPTIRANTIIALGDLTVRFPNLIEPWTPNLYARLRDDSPTVRKNTMIVLTRLILNDMVKVKGQISEMANCIVDEDDRISNMAKMFFNELSKKGNAIYNIMPDVISRLSDPDVGVEEENFKTIMRYLFSFIQKDRQCESLVEKLCHRFRATRTDRQIRDLAFCLSLLDYSERSIRKLQENLPCYADKLAEDDVFSSFTAIISKSKKFVKPETKVMVDELEAKLLECHTKGMNDEEIALKASQATEATRGRKTPGKGLKGKTPAARRQTRLTRDVYDDSDDDFDKRRKSGHPAARGGRTTRKPSGGQKGKKVVRPSFSSDDDSDLELFDVKEDEDAEEDTKGTPDNSADENIDPNTPPSAKQKKSGKKKLLVMSAGKSRKDSEVAT